MLLSDFRVRDGGGVRAAETDVVWEDTDRPPFRLFVETSGSGGAVLRADPSAFLPATLLAAWHAGESRVRVEGALCPLLRRRIHTALAVLREWQPDLGPPPRIASTRQDSVVSPSRSAAVSLLSCGVDSLFTLRWNLLHVPRGHPRAIQASIVVSYGREPAGSGEEFASEEDGRVASARVIGEDAGVDVIPARTNMWWMDGDGYFYDQRWHGAVLASIAACFSGGFSSAFIASTFEAGHLVPWGSHPLLDANYGTLHFRIEHDGEERTRFEKTQLVSEWPVALANLRVCQHDQSGARNCGTCEKCIRTMTALVALERLSASRAFPRDDVDPTLIATVREYGMIVHEWQRDWYQELKEPLERAGRRDLVRALDEYVLTP